jgi:hypothetical protein
MILPQFGDADNFPAVGSVCRWRDGTPNWCGQCLIGALTAINMAGLTLCVGDSEDGCDADRALSHSLAIARRREDVRNFEPASWVVAPSDGLAVATCATR